MKTYYQGEEIAFNLELYADQEETEPVNIDDISEIDIYVYTNGCRVVKLSKTSKTGYYKLLRNTAFQYAGVIESHETKYLSDGPIILEIRISYDSPIVVDGHWDKIQKAVIGNMGKSQIKNS